MYRIFPIMKFFDSLELYHNSKCCKFPTIKIFAQDLRELFIKSVNVYPLQMYLIHSWYTELPTE